MKIILTRNILSHETMIRLSVFLYRQLKVVNTTFDRKVIMALITTLNRSLVNGANCFNGWFVRLVNKVIVSTFPMIDLTKHNTELTYLKIDGVKVLKLTRDVNTYSITYDKYSDGRNYLIILTDNAWLAWKEFTEIREVYLKHFYQNDRNEIKTNYFLKGYLKDAMVI